LYFLLIFHSAPYCFPTFLMQKRARLSAEKEAEPVCEPSGLTPFFLKTIVFVMLDGIRVGVLSGNAR
jgi:hypothetical protein